MTKLRLVTYRELSKVAGRIVVIPDHGPQVIVRPLLRKVLRDMGLSLEEYHRLLEQL